MHPNDEGGKMSHDKGRQVAKENNYGRHSHTSTAPRKHGGNSQQGHQAGDGGAPMVVETRFPLPSQPPAPAWKARHSAAEIPNLHLRERMLLARPQRGHRQRPLRNQQLRMLQDTKVKHGILDKQDTTQQGTRHRRPTQTRRHGMALHNDMGMSAEAQAARTVP